MRVSAYDWRASLGSMAIAGWVSTRPAQVAILAALVLLQASPVWAASPKDYDVPNGHYYEQGTRIGTPSNNGFIVHDDEAAPIWGELRRLGGVRALGHPLSSRYECDEALCQVFRHAVLRWRTGAEEVELISVFDELNLIGRDDWLDRLWGVPAWTAVESEGSEANDPLALLDLNEALKSAYWRIGPMAPVVYGLPRAYKASEVVAVLRTQRAVLMQLVESPGHVKLLPAGQISLDAGLVPVAALVPVAGPEPGDASPPTQIRVPALGIDANVVPVDMKEDGALPAPDDAHVVAWYSYGARLGEGGNAVLAGHVDWNRQLGVFWRLREAQPGHLITLQGRDGRTYDYQIEWVRDYPAESLHSLAALRPRGGATTITLITCSGRFDFATRSYENRQVVRAVLLP